MSDWFRGAIPRDAQAVADNLDLWEKSSTIKGNGYLRRALRRAVGTLREVLAERDALQARVRELEGEAELATWRHR